MTSKRQDMALVGAGAAACAVCCAGPIVGFLAAVGLGSVLGVAMFGMIGLAVLAVGMIVMVRRRRRRTAACTAAADQHVDLIRNH